MPESEEQRGTVAGKHDRKSAPGATAAATPVVKSPMSKSMHDGVEVWCDCCSCEAEPYWVEAMALFDAQAARDHRES